jgi:hypothetical protein
MDEWVGGWMDGCLTLRKPEVLLKFSPYQYMIVCEYVSLSVCKCSHIAYYFGIR